MNERPVEIAPPAEVGGDTEDGGDAVEACEAWLARPVRTAEDARTRVGVALSLLELAAEVLEKVLPPETALPLGDRELFQYLQAAEAARVFLVGAEEGDSASRPARGSALGEGCRVYTWDEAEAERHFAAAVDDWSERQ